jgi:hypothetical protein
LAAPRAQQQLRQKMAGAGARPGAARDHGRYQEERAKYVTFIRSHGSLPKMRDKQGRNRDYGQA